LEGKNSLKKTKLEEKQKKKSKIHL